MNTIQKFQDLLKRLFQFETSDLDFGILKEGRKVRERRSREDLRQRW